MFPNFLTQVTDGMWGFAFWFLFDFFNFLDESKFCNKIREKKKKLNFHN